MLTLFIINSVMTFPGFIPLFWRNIFCPLLSTSDMPITKIPAIAALLQLCYHMQPPACLKLYLFAFSRQNTKNFRLSTTLPPLSELKETGLESRDDYECLNAFPVNFQNVPVSAVILIEIYYLFIFFPSTRTISPGTAINTLT